MTPPVGGRRLTAETGPLANRKMPELPEVEIARRTLERWLGGSAVIGAEADRTRVFRAGGRGAFGRFRGRLARADRHGKLLLVSLDSGQGFLSHLGMTGNGPPPRRGGRPGTLGPPRLARWQRRPLTATPPFGRRATPRRDPARAPGGARSGPTRCPSRCRAGAPRRARSDPRPIKVALEGLKRLAGPGNIHAAEALRGQAEPGPRTGSLLAEWNRLAILRRGRRSPCPPRTQELYVEGPGRRTCSAHARAARPAPAHRSGLLAGGPENRFPSRVSRQETST
jgi:formamidopyrimidine-DNA glycosylase